MDCDSCEDHGTAKKKNNRSKLTLRSALRAVSLHSHVCVEVVQSAIGLLTALPSTLVHALDLLVATARTLVLLGTRDRDEGVDLQQNHRVSAPRSTPCGGKSQSLKITNEKEMRCF